MSKKLFVVAAVLVALGAVAVAARQAQTETAKDLVCGMTVNKATAKHTYEYKGETYYFCSAGCKDAFAKDPEKYLAKEKEAAGKPAAGGMGGMMHGQMQGHMQGQMGQMQGGMMAGCPMMLPGVEKKVENTKDGIVVTLTSKDPEMVKKLQEHGAMMMKAAPAEKKEPAAAAGPMTGCEGGCCKIKK